MSLKRLTCEDKSLGFNESLLKTSKGNIYSLVNMDIYRMFTSDTNSLGTERKRLFCFELWGSEMRFMYYCVSNKEK